MPARIRWRRIPCSHSENTDSEPTERHGRRGQIGRFGERYETNLQFSESFSLKEFSLIKEHGSSPDDRSRDSAIYFTSVE